MKYLYHGTTAETARVALREGLKPRGEHGNTNWTRTVESNPNSVYLTDAYPLFFALNAADKARGEPAVIQLDVEKLPQLWLVPDEDVLEQAGRGKDDVRGNMKTRTRCYRKRLNEYVATDKWQVSLQAMGTCGCLAAIPPEAISSVAFIDQKAAPTLCMAASDASIHLLNYRFCATKYRNMTNRIFGLPLEADPLSAARGSVDNLPEGEEFDAFRKIVEYERAYEQRLADEIANAVTFSSALETERRSTLLRPEGV